MGIMSFIRSQFIEIVEWLDDSNHTLVWRFPDDDHEIKNGAKLVCRPGQAAVFVNEGEVADVFGPGTHTLSTENLPVLSRLRAGGRGPGGSRCSGCGSPGRRRRRPRPR